MDGSIGRKRVTRRSHAVPLFPRSELCITQILLARWEPRRSAARRQISPPCEGGVRGGECRGTSCWDGTHVRRPFANGAKRTAETTPPNLPFARGGKWTGAHVALPFRRCRGTSLLLLLALSACSPTLAPPDLPRAEETLARAGKRLSNKLSASDLTEIATNADRVLASLSARERDALARGYCRFQVDRPVQVVVAVPRGAAPFWLNDLGFTPWEKPLRDSEVTWDLHSRTFPAGWVGLGVNGLDRRPVAHYAVFISTLDGRPVSIQNAAPDGWEPTTAGLGVALEREQGRGLDELPPDLLGVKLLRKPHDQRHSTMLARGRVWKTHSASSANPDQVAISFGEDPARMLTFTWRTAVDSLSSLLRLRDSRGTIHEYQGKSELVHLPDLLNDPLICRHVVCTTDLQPGSRYDYALSGQADWRSVRTAAETDADMCLLYMGDPQCGLEGWGKLLSAAQRHRPDASALLIAGDLVDRGNERTNWDHFFLRAAPVLDSLPLMPAVGNHEYLDRGPWLYRALFALPENGPSGIAADLAYSVEIGDVFLAVLDSTAAVFDPAQALLQAEWLDQRLKATRRTWKLVMFHHPIHASHPWRENPSLAKAWVPVFDRHHVDLVLQGHDHAYLRTYPMRNGHRVDSTRDGTVYVVAVSGDKYCEQRASDYAEVGFTGVSTYQTIDVHPRENRLIYKSFDINRREWDSVTIEKPPAPDSLADRRIKTSVSR